MKKTTKIHIDTWRLSYEQPHNLFERLVEDFARYGGSIDFGEWRLCKKEDDEAAEVTEINADVLLSDGSVLGNFRFNNSPQYRGLTFFTFTNKALYEGGAMAMLGVVTDDLGLRLRTQTQIDIAVDANYNLYLPIMRLVKDYDHFDMVLNGVRVGDANRTLQGIGEWFSRSRKKRERFPTLYFEQRRNDGLKLRCYDKGKEIEESGKTYIADGNGFGEKTWRFEVVIKWAQFKRWLRFIEDADFTAPSEEWKRRPNESEQEHLERTVHTLMLDDAYLLALWSWANDHVLYFRNKRTNAKISIMSLLGL